jgi:hypothetical protein
MTSRIRRLRVVGLLQNDHTWLRNGDFFTGAGLEG